MLKILLLIGVALAVYLVVRTYRRSLTRAEPPPAVESMVQCARCGVNMPRSEALCDQGVCVCPPSQPCDQRD